MGLTPASAFHPHAQRSAFRLCWNTFAVYRRAANAPLFKHRVTSSYEGERDKRGGKTKRLPRLPCSHARKVAKIPLINHVKHGGEPKASFEKKLCLRFAHYDAVIRVYDAAGNVIETHERF